MDFADGPAVEKKVKGLLERAKRARIAVAYWGAGAVDRLGLGKVPSIDLVVVCDLLSGGCNPTEIGTLREMLGPDRVLTCDRLHAKVWLTDMGAVVGSSNASANGLGAEASETAGLIEANIFIDDSTMLAVLEQWFEQSISPYARPIRDEDIQRARSRWKCRRKKRPQPQGASVLDVLSKEPTKYADRDLFVWVYDHNAPLSAWAEKELEAARKERHDSSLYAWEDAEAAPGAYIFDFHLQKNGRARFRGLWRVLRDQPRRGNQRHWILLCRQEKDLGGTEIGDTSRWEAAATRAVTTGQDEWELSDFARFLPTRA
jgi:hypothetical protein